MNSSVALIIATYNWPAALQQTLRSVAHQSILPNEVLIADDGSDERTTNLIQEFKEAKLTFSDSNNSCVIFLPRSNLLPVTK